MIPNNSQWKSNPSIEAKASSYPPSGKLSLCLCDITNM